MIFNRLIVLLALVASTATASTSTLRHSSGAAGDDGEDARMKQKIRDLEDTVASLENMVKNLGEKVEGRKPTNKVQRGTLYSKDKPRRQKSSEANGERKLSKKGSKTDKLCYEGGDLAPKLGTFALGEEFFEGSDLDRGVLEFGLVQVRGDGVSLKIEISATTLLAEFKGGIIIDGPTFYLVGAGVLVYPILRTCPTDHNCDSHDEGYTECVAEYCRAEGDVLVTGPGGPPDWIVKPAPFLPLDVEVIAGYQNGLDAEYYEIIGQLELSSTTAKFFIPSTYLPDDEYLLDFAFITAAGGIHLNAAEFDVPDWQLAGAILGPHVVEVEAVEQLYEECDWGIED